MLTLTLRVDNMHCGACVRRVLQTLNALPGTHVEEVQIGHARVRTEEADADVCATLAAAGFPAHLAASEQAAP